LELLKSAIQFFYRHVRFDDGTLARNKGNAFFHLFDERECHSNIDVDSVLIESAYDTSLNHVSTFILTILHQGLFSVQTFVIAIIYLSRFKEVTKVSIHSYTWRYLFLTALLVADKSNEDKPIRLGSLAKLFPVISAKKLCELELAFCLETRFTFLVKLDLYESFVMKLFREKPLPRDIDQTVERSEYVQQVLTHSQRAVPCTPQTVIKKTTSNVRSRSTQPTIFKTHIIDECTVISSRDRFSPELKHVSPRRPSRGSTRVRSASLSRVLSVSSFIEDEDPNSSRHSRNASSRRASMDSRKVPPPPAFEPLNRTSGRRSPSVFVRPHFHSPTPGCIYPIRPLGSRTGARNQFMLY
jgi:hypothetical protein